MKRSNLVILTVLGTVGGLLLAIGMCMCLIPAWNAFTPGVVLAIIGAITLLSIWPIGRKAAGKAAIHFTAGYAATALVGLIGAIAFCIGLVNCLGTVSTFGLAVGITGIILIVAAILIGRIAAGKAAVAVNGQKLLAYIIGIIGALILGVGMCMTMVWGVGLMIPGIVVGIIGLLVCILNLVLRVTKTA